jgi:UDP-N-acetylglucosamine diphosphorylase / glucose-1-phosphate thymidylyltransferase / UDP-N-acetylgalactosamine diphosphorylase / glucosamine-1-phosphate N-acetyltransferase / galactosamine-1-phosphate N-acetyltransferase
VIPVMMRKAVILAAGRGTRMGALTGELPKPMLPIEGKPMLEHIVRRLGQAGIAEILIVVGYRRELIERHFVRGFTGISFAVQQVVEGTAAAMKLARAFVAADPFLLTYGDIICGFANYTGISAALARHAASAVLGVKRVDDPWQGAAVYADEQGVVSGIIEKPPRGASTTHWNSAGLYAFSPVIFEEIDTVGKSPRGEYEITSAIQQLIGHGQPVRLFEIEGAWRDVGRPEDLAQADLDLSDSSSPRG